MQQSRILLLYQFCFIFQYFCPTIFYSQLLNFFFISYLYSNISNWQYLCHPEFSIGNVVFYEIGINSRYNFFGSLFFHFLYQDIIIELDYYFIISVIKGKICLCIGRHYHLSLQFGKSYYCCLLFFQNFKLVVYAILLWRLFFCKRFYAFKLLPYLYYCQTTIGCFYILNAKTYNFLYLLNMYSIIGFDFF